MCDIVTLKCKWCGRGVSSHLGDFSVGRRQVQVFCPKKECQAAALRILQGYHRLWAGAEQTREWSESPRYRPQPHIVFADSVQMDDGHEVPILYLVDWPRGINTNGGDEQVFVAVPEGLAPED